MNNLAQTYGIDPNNHTLWIPNGYNSTLGFPK